MTFASASQFHIYLRWVTDGSFAALDMVYLMGCSVKMASVCVFSAAKKTERGVHGAGAGLAGGSITLHRTLPLITKHHSWPGHIATMVTTAISVFNYHTMYDFSHKLKKMATKALLRS